MADAETQSPPASENGVEESSQGKVEAVSGSTVDVANTSSADSVQGHGVSTASSSDRNESTSGTKRSGQHGQKLPTAKKRKKIGKDILFEVIDAKGDMAVGSQVSLTQADPEAHELLGEVLATARGRDYRFTFEQHQDDPNLVDFIQTCFRGSPPDDPHGLERRLLLYKLTFQLANRGYQNKRNGLLNFLLTETYNLPASCLPAMVERAIQGLSDQDTIYGGSDRWHPFEFVPELLSRTLEVEKGELDPNKFCANEVSSMDGAEYTTHIIEKICQLNWLNGSAETIVSTLTECSSLFTPRLAVQVVHKAICQLSSCVFEALPRLTNHILMMLTTASKLKVNVQVELLDKLICTIEDLDKRCGENDDNHVDLFDESGLSLGKGAQQQSRRDFLSDPNSSAYQDFKSLLEAEGAIIGNFCLVISRDVALGKAFIKFCLAPKGGLNRLGVFRLGLLMGLARVKQLETRVFDLLISRTRMHTSQADRSARSPFLHRFCAKPRERGVFARDAFEANEMEALLDDLVRYSSIGGWDSVIQALAPLGTKLMDCHNVYTPSHLLLRDVRIAQGACRDETTGNASGDRERNVESEGVDEWEKLNAGNPNAAVASLGVLLLAKSFAKHSIAQRDILEFVRLRVLGATATVAVSGHQLENNVFQVVRLIAQLVDTEPHLLINSANFIKDILAGLPKVSPRLAHGLLHALQPLFRIRADLVDFGVLVFRKALFQRDLAPRIVAVQGLLVMARNVEAISQEAKAEQQNDIISSIHRCLTHQAQVRAAVYTGFGELLNSDDIEATVKRTVFEILVTHLDSLLMEPLVEDAIKTVNANKSRPENVNSNSSSSSSSNNNNNNNNNTNDELDQTTVFPFMLADKCLDRPGGVVCEPIHVLLKQIKRVATDFPDNSSDQKVAQEILSKLVAKVCLCDVEELLATVSSNQNLAQLGAFICEVLQSFTLSAKIWDVQQALVARYLTLKPSLGNKRASAQFAPPATPRGDDETASATGSEKEKAKSVAGTILGIAALTKFPTCLETSELVALLETEGEKDEVLRVKFYNFLAGILPSQCALFRETRNVAQSAARELIVGTEMSICCESASLCAGASDAIQTKRAEVAIVGRYLARVLLHAGEDELSLSQVCAFKDCMLACIETGWLDRFLADTIIEEAKTLSDHGQDDEEREEKEMMLEDDAARTGDAPSPVDKTLAALRTHVIDAILSKGTGKSINLNAVPLHWLDLFIALLPKSQRPKPHARWLREMLAQTHVGAKHSKFIQKVIPAYILSMEVCSKSRHSLHGAVDLAESIARLLDVESDDEADAGENDNSNHGQRKGAKKQQTLDFPFLADQKFVSCSLLALCQKLNEVYEECEWAAALMHEDPLLLPKTGTEDDAGSPQQLSAEKFELAVAARTDQMRLFCSHTSQAVRACAALVSDELPRDRSRDQILKLSMRHYKLSVVILKSLLVSKPMDIPSHVEALLEKTRTLTENIYKLLATDSSNRSTEHCDEAQRRAAAGFAEKEARLVPNLIFQIEQYNVHLLRLSKVAKQSEDMLSSMVVNSLNRDFKISKAKHSRKRRAGSELENITNVVQNDAVED